ncbi:MAG: transglycosylase SLT domain-containing protein [Fretibacterium sp.]|nr:transglycosylase SLT domain-containing protein [Fretibacterium sp.]
MTLKKIAGACLLWLLLLPVTAGAKPGKFELPPPSAEGRLIKADVFPQTVAAKEARLRANGESSKKTPSAKQREAQIRSIAELFSRYNKKLSAKQARQYAEYILQAGDKFGQEPFVLAAMVVHESSANASAVSRGGDYGLMQVRWNVHKKRIMKQYPSVKKAKDFLDPKVNILVGTEIFTEYRSDVGPDLRAGLLRYSAGNKKLANKIFATVKELESAQKKHLKAIK